MMTSFWQTSPSSVALDPLEKYLVELCRFAHVLRETVTKSVKNRGRLSLCHRYPSCFRRRLDCNPTHRGRHSELLASFDGGGSPHHPAYAISGFQVIRQSVDSDEIGFMPRWTPERRHKSTTLPIHRLPLDMVSIDILWYIMLILMSQLHLCNYCCKLSIMRHYKQLCSYIGKHFVNNL